MRVGRRVLAPLVLAWLVDGLFWHHSSLRTGTGTGTGMEMEMEM
jgi:hypothetical protein